MQVTERCRVDDCTDTAHDVSPVSNAHGSLYLHEQQMASPTLLDVNHGVAAVFTNRSPAKDTPNEDSAAIIAISENRALLAVADGVGGHAKGERASRLAVEALGTCAAEEGHDPDQLRNVVLDGFERANQAILELGSGAATTLAVAEIDDRGVRAYHAGDSAVLVTGQRGRVKMQTLAHGPVAYAVEAGVIDETEAMHHDERSIITNLIGSPEMRIEIGSAVDLSARDTVLVASDGVFDNLETGEIIDIIRRGPLLDAAELLKATCSARMATPKVGEPSAPDDLTFILFRLR
jgi:serine/threonine protein phosphatase PrpC